MPFTSALDLPTLFLVATALAALLGIFLLAAWLQEKNMRALAWWGAAYLLGGSAMASWVQPPASPLLVEVPIALLLIACGMVWNGVRVFFGRRVLPLAIFAGALTWLVASHAGVIAEAAGGRLVLGGLIVSVYAFCTTLELRRDRRKLPVSRLRMVMVPALHAMIFLLPLALRIVSLQSGPTEAGMELFALETMLYAVGIAVIVLLMVKDHHVHVHKAAAATDPLTGLFNRRGFVDAAHELIGRSARERIPVSVLMFDLDRFKSINDRFGHAVGDDVIKRFAQTIGTSVRVSDVVGRLGGEEFAAIIPGGRSVCGLVGERVRANFEVAGVQFRELQINATCSVGAASDDAGAIAASGGLERLMERADSALYLAKEQGRNRVKIDGPIAQHPVARHIAAARAANLPVVSAPPLVPSMSAATEKV